ncbi:non-homologous end joining protein Ku [Paraliomyxa miuraensis]|uniref:non-homologous end joining protein Ku n=1 Tax=Paraliomyxa miuraensis TaxID=376150 RepID=UPI00225018BF|nr:Ku protein [Paraliomyxa miuraensis]MCX4241100.1 Ku protein [Paraliomyxa miuraensis]
MPARAIASGTIAFGLVSIPVKLFPSASPSDALRFNNLHRECGGRVKYQYWCPKDEKVLTRGEMIKGYEFAKGQYVTFEADELEAVAERTSGGIDITEFLPETAVDPIYYDKAYYLAPDHGAGRAYHLLAAALRQTGLSALARYAARGKQYLVLIRPIAQGLVMQQLHYPAEIRPVADVGIETSEVKEAELQLAVALIRQGAVKTFAPTKYSDEVRERVEALIAKKVEGEEITAPVPSARAQVIDLMAALKESLGVGADGAELAEPPSADEQGQGAPREASGGRTGG